MFGERAIKETSSAGSMNGLLEKGCEFEGKLTFEGTVRIHGKFTGEIFSEGTLIVGEGAEVDAKMEVGSVVIHGHVSGTIAASDRIEMHAPAAVRGDISTQTLVIEEGVLFEGSCAMARQATVHNLEAAAKSY
ncbi:MAG: polymer-forming cytoskeletal protein [Deltaproteobacteria bacterium]|nr:polymer-forming cytoskeletal protein [Deltaproteobacteria bacterium]